MSSYQIVNFNAPVVQAYSFLSKPPPPAQKKRPTQPPPPIPRKRSSTFGAIAAWASHVQPGSPGSPHSPRRRPSLSRRPSASSRRPSISRTPSPRSTSHSFLVIETPSPATKEFAVDLTDLGYTSVFVHLPKTPNTPAPFFMKSSGSPVNPESFPVPATRTRTHPLKRFRSLSILRSRGRSTSGTLPPSPTKSTRTSKPRSPMKPDSPQILAATIAKRKKAVYAFAKPSKVKAKPQKEKPALPPSLAAELALMQFADGGSTEANIKRLMEAHARATAPAGTKSTETGVGDVYRDGKGGIWWDREEEMEYVHLLGGNSSSHVTGFEKWVSFGGEVKEGKYSEDDDAALALASLAGLGRRDSANSIASVNSSLDPCNVIKPAEDDAAMLRVPLVPVHSTPAASTTEAQKENQAPQPKRRHTPEPILTVPSRPRAQAHHLHASPNFFLLDLNAFSVPTTPRTPRTPRTPHTPGSPYPCTRATRAGQHTRTRSSPVRSAFTSHRTQGQRLRGPARRRPAPLTIVAHAPMRGVSPDLDEVDVEMAEAEKAKRDFLNASFEPAPAPTSPARVVASLPTPIALKAAVAHPEKERSLKKKASRPLFGFFMRK